MYLIDGEGRNVSKEKAKPSATEAAVASFNEAKNELHAFLKDPNIKDVLLEYEQLVEMYNSRLDQATRLVKAMVRHSDQNKVFIDGIGAQKKFKRYYDAEFLACTLPADQFDEFAKERIVYDLDLDRLEQLVRQGEVDGAIVEKARRVEEQNPSNLPGTPKPYNLPAIPVGDE